MLVPISSLRPGHRFRYDGRPYMRCEAGKANCIALRDGLGFQVLHFSTFVEVPPFSLEEQMQISEEEQAYEDEMQAKGISMLDRLAQDIHPLDEE